MSEEPRVSKASAMKRARELELERAALERKGALEVWRRSRRPMQIVLFTLPGAVGALVGFVVMIVSKSALVGAAFGLVLALAVFVMTGVVLGGLVATDAVVSEGRKGLERRRIVRKRKALLDATEVAGGVELADDARAGGELSPADPGGGLTPVDGSGEGAPRH
jgi:hypothetical protein